MANQRLAFKKPHDHIGIASRVNVSVSYAMAPPGIEYPLDPYIEDLTVRGRSYAEVQAMFSAVWAADDTFTAPG